MNYAVVAGIYKAAKMNYAVAAGIYKAAKRNYGFALLWQNTRN